MPGAPSLRSRREIAARFEHSGLARQARRPVVIAAVVTAVYLGWVAVFFAAGHEVRDFVRIGVNFVTQSDRSSVIEFDPEYDYPENRDPNRPGDGYDGQFYYYLALDPSNARYYMDEAGYRYSRPLYPAIVRVLSLGEPDAVPWLMLAVNLLAVFLGTLALASWFRREGHHPWPALIFGLAPGLLLAVQRDLTEPLAFGLVAAAFLVWQRQTRWSWVAAAGVLALAALARQTTLVFAAVFALAILVAGSGPLRSRIAANWGRAAAFAAIAVVPYGLYVLAVENWIGPSTSSGEFTPIPFGGFAEGDIELKRQGVLIPTVAVPVLIWMGLAVILLRRGLAWIPALCVIANGLAFLVFRVDSNAYTARGRTVLGVALAAAMLAPAVMTLAQNAKRWQAVAIALWLSMLPVIAVYGMTSGSL